MNILICGNGNIGKHISEEFKPSNEIFIYDKYKPPYDDAQILEKHYNACFVCVPTEMQPDGSADTTEIFDIIPHIKADVIIIRSTIPVGTCEKLAEQGFRNIVFCPEHYGMTQHALTNPGFAILGGADHLRNLAVNVFMTVKSADFHFIFTDWKTAELSKYMLNAFLAMKVTFCNEFACIASSFGINYNQLRECFIADGRVGNSHTFVYQDEPFYNSHCFNKDVPAIIKQAEERSVDTPVLSTMYNENIRRKRLWQQP